ncbi:BTAD domain-containing putative transcriptional regulator, partial [Streptomyces noursei]|uniref:BTAD domain-containing putative transcriptional regulator n=1 Tax=Streptomyces noursei TaxID=1971 RepID=UPI002277A434
MGGRPRPGPRPGPGRHRRSPPRRPERPRSAAGTGGAGAGGPLPAPGGVGGAPGPGEVALFRFGGRAPGAAAARRAGAPGPAARLLDGALRLWRGPALADLPDRDGDPLAVRAERRRTEARRDRLAADVALGHAEAALAGLAELATAHPLDEPLA